jgi:hypothetical protein
MIRVTSPHLRALRLLAALGAIPAVWACTSHTLAPPIEPPITTQEKTFPVGQNRDLDLLFMVDNSLSMKGLQDKMAQRLPDFMKVLEDLPGGLPNLHVAVVSSSLATGAADNHQIGCGLGSPPGDDGGRFQHAARCTGLNAGQTFIKAVPGGNNFTGNLAEVFACIATLGDGGCGIEQQFQATKMALEKARNPADPDNGGFLREDAILGVIMLTNEDDCSVDFSSTLFDPNQIMLSDPLGGLQNYRCNEFGHLCDGVPPPHQVSQSVTLNNCVPAEDKGRLVRVADFVAYLKSLKPDPQRLFVAALAGDPSKYTIDAEPRDLPNGGKEVQPTIRHSCTATDNPKDDYADPPVRVAAFIRSFPESNSKLASICEQNFQPAMEDIARALSALVRPPCLEHPVALTAKGRPNCQVAVTSGGTARDTLVPECTAGGTVFPCWRLDQLADCPVGGQLNVCWEETCDPAKAPATAASAEATCAVGT